MLSFTIYYLLKNPATLMKLRQEVDRVVGNEDIRVEHLDQLPYLVGVYFSYFISVAMSETSCQL